MDKKLSDPGEKRKSEYNEDEDENQHDKGNLVNDGDLQKKDKKKKRKRDSSDTAQIEENEPAQNDGTDLNMKDSQDGKRKKVKVSKVKKKSTESVENKTDGLIQGKRFTPEEDAIIKEAVLNYITARDLGDEGLKVVLNCKSHPGMQKCWQDIGTCIPYRPYIAVYHRAHKIFERGDRRHWTLEEIDLLKEYHKKHRNSWKKIADELGKNQVHVKDTWRRIKLQNLKGRKWSQEEYQNLHDLVNLDLQMKINSEKKSQHGMLRDNIHWTAISEKLSTRNDATCRLKWYNQLTSSLVAEKKWCDADDYRMIGVLYELDATCAEDVDWDNVLEHRPGDICRKRWDQMVKHIGHQGSKPFAEQGDILAKRYCPDLAETREIWDNIAVVD